jgi:8-oxo-dGTP diphosphatase
MLKLPPEMNYSFKGFNQSNIDLILFPRCNENVGHVAIYAYYYDFLLFTKHRSRGIEWPGGKVEEDETPLQAAIRELYEETGAIASSMSLIGQYKVVVPGEYSMIKNVYFTDVTNKLDIHNDANTAGPILLPKNIIPSLEGGFSPYVLDPVFLHIRRAVCSTKLLLLTHNVQQLVV